jgi:molybdate transport system regulatory protein
MKLSARNQLSGTVVSVKKGAVMAEVVVKLAGGEEVVAAITVGSVESLGIVEGGPVTVVIKATAVMLAAE